MPSHEQLLLQAIAIARDARAHGNHPFGALLADLDGRVLLTAENTVVSTGDATGHAETNLVRVATTAHSPAELTETVLYTSTEPCAMCAGAIYWSHIPTVIYALAETALHELAGSDPENLTLALPCRTVFDAGRRPITVLGPFDLPEAHAASTTLTPTETIRTVRRGHTLREGCRRTLRGRRRVPSRVRCRRAGRR